MFKKIALALLAAVVVIITGGLAYILLFLPNVGPAPEMTIELTEARKVRGHYMAHHVAVCMDCHSQRDWNRLTGPLVPGTLGQGGEEFSELMGFPGNFTAKNITPASIGEWTDGELYRAITTGVSRDGKPLFPIMPYRSYAKMDPEDVRSIIAYIRSLPAIAHEVPASTAKFPMNIILHTIPQKAEGGKLPDKSDRVAYGAYLTTAASCLDCHSQQKKGEILPGMEYAGGMKFPLPTGTVQSANITPHETGIAKWTREEFIRKFKSYGPSFEPNEIKSGFQTVMPWTMYAGMTEEDLGAIYDYLRTIPPVSNKVDPFTPKGS